MKTICLYFEIHQITHLKRYRFFDIGTDHYYYDDYENERSITDVAERSYIPALQTLIGMAKENGKFFKLAISISGVAIEQLENHAPQVLELLQELNETGCVEFLAEPYSHGLSSLANETCFRDEVKRQSRKMKELFGQTPKVLRNSSLIYSNEIGSIAHSMGFKGMLTEGAKHVLGWKSPHFVYCCEEAPNLKLLLRDYKLSDDISLRFNNSSWNEYPLFADTYMNWIQQLPDDEQIINIFMELCALGIFQPLSSNILEFIKALPACARQKGISFSTPSEICMKTKAVDRLDVQYPLSWVDEERDTSCWLGNVMQREAFNKLYSIADKVLACTDRRIKQDWDYLQASNNFRFMTTKNSSVSMYRGIYSSPYDAFTNYMNILGDFMRRVNDLYPSDMDSEQLNSLLTIIRNQGEEIELKDKEINKLETKLQKLEPTQAKVAEQTVAKPAKKAAAKPAAKKPAAKEETAPKVEVKKEEPAKKAVTSKPASKKQTPKKAAAKKAEPKKAAQKKV
jgi:alpha-amylase